MSLTHPIVIITTLPFLDTCGLHGTGLSLWHTLPQAENTALKDPSCTKTKYNDPLIGIRLLGFFLKDFWDHAHDGYLRSNLYAHMVMAITSCLNKLDDKATYDTLIELGLRYHNYLLQVCELHNYLLNALNNLQFIPTQEVDPHHRDMSLDHLLTL
jgi:hypothetical protein